MGLEFHMPSGTALLAQLTLGLINGSFYALLSLGLAIIYGLLGIINFTHGALYMTGAFAAWGLLTYLGVGYYGALILAPLIVGAFSLFLERAFISRTYRLDHAYSLLLTFGLALVIEGLFRQFFSTGGQPYSIPAGLSGAIDLGYMYLPTYRAWVLGASIAVCIATWFLIERTRLGANSRAATENAALTQALGVNVPLLMSLTYAGGGALAGLAGVFAAPIYLVSPLMGQEILIVVFAVVVIGGMGSIKGAILSGFALGLIEGLSKAVVPSASSLVIFIAMAIILLLRPAGLFGRGVLLAASHSVIKGGADTRVGRVTVLVLLALGILAPMMIYPVFLMKAFCFALFACSFNLVLGYGGLLSFGHAAFFGSAAYAAAHATKIWGLTPELGILFGVAVSAALGWMIGALSVRRQGIYLAMISLALAQLVYFICLRAPFTHGEDGLQGVPRGYFLGLIDLTDQMTMYFFVFGVFIVGFFVYWLIINSPFGQALNAVRENEPRAISLGYRVDRIKTLCFALSGAIAGLGGATKALVFGIASLGDVHFFVSGDAILMVLLGGLGTVLGPVIGAFTLIAMESYLQAYGSWIKVIQGVFFVPLRAGVPAGAAGAVPADGGPGAGRGDAPSRKEAGGLGPEILRGVQIGRIPQAPDSTLISGCR